jgi:hypothetical protein
MGYTNGERWTEDKIKSEILKVVKVLNLERMPSNTEIQMVMGDSRLSNAIRRQGGFYSLGESLGLPIKPSETQTGKGYEEYAVGLLVNRGYKVERMSVRHPYDLLVNDNIKIDTKAGNPYFLKGSRVHTIGINKKNATCDLYMIFALDENSNVEKLFIIPGSRLKLTSLNFGEDSKYDKYLDRWDLIEKYDRFYKSIVQAIQEVTI